MSELKPVCSPRPRPSVQKGAKGNQWWRRDVYHMTADGRSTLCGRDCSDWLRLDCVIVIPAVDADCCKRCAARAW